MPLVPVRQVQSLPAGQLHGLRPLGARAALSRYITHPAAFSFKLPDNVSTLEGALVEPLAVGLHAASRAGAGLGQTAVILGSGCIGLMTLLACRSMGVSRVVMADLFDNRLWRPPPAWAPI